MIGMGFFVYILKTSTTNKVNMKKYVLTIMLMSIPFATGCASYMAKQKWDNARQAQAVQVQADGQGVMIGVDLLSMDYLKDNWKWAIPAAVADAAILYGAYEAVNDVVDSGGSTGGDSQKVGRDNATLNIIGDKNAVNVEITGDSTSTEN